MREVTCVVIDDEELSRDLIDNFVERHSDLNLVGKFANPLEALLIFSEREIDLVFLDIQMPEMTGIEFLKTLSKPPSVIFTTAYDRYALAGYELSVIDYLLKPFSFHRFLKAVNKAIEIIDLRRNEGNYDLALPTKEQPQPLEFLLVNADHKLHRIYLKDILYVQSMKEYVVYFTDKEKIMALGSLKSLVDKLPAAEFMRVHKSFIVCKKRVKSLEGNQLHIEDVTLPIGGSYRNKVLEELFKR